MSNIYQPENMPEIEITYEIFPGSPAFDDDIEIQHICINGDKISVDLETHLIEHFKFDEDILNLIT